jgi:hypothetical protein
MATMQWIAINALKPNPRNARTTLEQADPPDRGQHRRVRFSGPDSHRRKLRRHRRSWPACCGKTARSETSAGDRVQGLSEAKRRALALADNKIAESLTLQYGY